MEWIDNNVRKPTIEEANKCCYRFVCYVIVPTTGGCYDTDIKCLTYNSLNKNWDCEDMIVTHWTIAEIPNTTFDYFDINEVYYKKVSECDSIEYCQGWNEAINEMKRHKNN